MVNANIKRNASNNAGRLERFLYKFRGISHKLDDKTKTEISPKEKAALLEECLDFFEQGLLTSEQNDIFMKILEENISNYSSFQRLMSVLVMKWVGIILKGGEYHFPKVTVFCTNCPTGVFYNGKKIYRILPTGEPIKALLTFYEKEFSNNLIPSWVFSHEISHLCHMMIASLVIPHDDWQHNFNEDVSFLTDSVLANENLRGLLYPPLSTENLDFNKNPVLRRIKEMIKQHPQEFASLKEGIQQTPTSNSNCTNHENQYMKDSIVSLIKIGFGRVIFGVLWEQCDISQELTPEILAKVIYINTFLTGCNQTIQERVNMWTSNEEVLTILGIAPFLFAGKYVVLSDRQHETIFRYRDLLDDVESEEKAQIFRTHTPRGEEVNDSNIAGVTPLFTIPYSVYAGTIIYNLQTLGFKDFDKASTNALFKNDCQLVNLFYPSKTIHTTESSMPDNSLYCVEPLSGADFWADLSHTDGFVNHFGGEEELLISAAAANFEKLVEPFTKFIKNMPLNQVNNLYDGGTMLHILAKNGRLEFCKFLIEEKGANVDATDKLLRTPLHWAIIEGHTDVVCYLLNKNAKCNIIDKDGNTPLHLAAIKEQPDILQILVRCGADVTKQNNNLETPLFRAIYKNCWQNAQFLLPLNRGGNITAVSSNGATLLHMAVLRNNFDIVEKLLERSDINVNSRTSNQKQTPLHLAITNRNLAIVKILLEKGAEVDIRNLNEETPLQLAVTLKNIDEAERLRIVEYLAEYCATVKIAPGSPLQLALEKLPSDNETRIFLEEIAD
jgi:ankyrin repeat protein